MSINNQSWSDTDNKPYLEQAVLPNVVKRFFSREIDRSRLKWHTDAETRAVTPLNNCDWLFQFENKLPINMEKGVTIIIPKGTQHRVIKGKTNLLVEIEKYYL